MPNNEQVNKIPEHWFQHRVSYGETDTMGVLYYGEYFHIFERGRSSFIRALGLSYNKVEGKGLYLPVRETQCRYRLPARYDDLLNLKISLTKMTRASLNFNYEVYIEGQEKLLSTGFTQHACVDNSGKPIAVPSWFKELCYS